MSETPDVRLPVEMKITIASATEAIEYWLKSAVFKDGVAAKLEGIRWNGPENLFTVIIRRS